MFIESNSLILNMHSAATISNKLKMLLPVLRERFHVERIGYFGSHARGTAHKKSDIDLLVSFSQPIGWQFFALEQFLEEQLGNPIDLVTESALKDRLREPIMSEIIFV